MSPRWKTKYQGKLRLPSEVLGNWSWLVSWLTALPLKIWVLTTFCAIFIFIMPFIYRPTRMTNSIASRSSYLYLPLVLSMSAWFFTAPNVRFLGLIPELIVLLTAFIFCNYFTQTAFWIRHTKTINNVFITLSLGWVITFFLNLPFQQDLLIFLGVAHFYSGLSKPEADWLVDCFNWNIVNIALIYLFFSVVRVSKIKCLGFTINPIVVQIILTAAIINQLTLSMGFWWAAQEGWRPTSPTAYAAQTISGITVNITTRGDQCGDAPLPCTPSFNVHLRKISSPFAFSFLNNYFIFYGWRFQ